MAEVLDALLAHILIPLLVAALPLLGAWLLTLLPGPVRNWLQSATHQRDVELVMGVMVRRALASTARGAIPGGVPDVIAYVQHNLPETIAKLAPSDDALRTMAAAAIQQAAGRFVPLGGNTARVSSP